MYLYQLFFYFVLYSFLGWCIEVSYAYYTENRFINRGFLHGPFCPIYGFGSLAIILLSGPVISIVYLNSIEVLLVTFLYAVIITSVLEYITGAILEKFFHTTWWNYSNRRFNLKGRICLSFSIIWGIASVILIFIIHPFIKNLVLKIPTTPGLIFVSIITAYLVIDFIFTLRLLFNFSAVLKELDNVSMQAKQKMLTDIEEIKENILKKKQDFIPLFTFSTNIKNILVNINVNTDLKKYTPLSHFKISDQIIPDLKTLRKKNITALQKALVEHQLMYNKFIIKYRRLLKAFPKLEFKNIKRLIDKE